MISATPSIYANKDEQMMYEYTAKEIINNYGNSRNVCMEIGTGPGFLGLQLTHQSNMTIYMIDMKSSALEKAIKNAELFGLKDKINFLQADVADLPFGDNYADLVTIQ